MMNRLDSTGWMDLFLHQTRTLNKSV